MGLRGRGVGGLEERGYVEGGKNVGDVYGRGMRVKKMEEGGKGMRGWVLFGIEEIEKGVRMIRWLIWEK